MAISGEASILHTYYLEGHRCWLGGVWSCRFRFLRPCSEALDTGKLPCNDKKAYLKMMTSKEHNYVNLRRYVVKFGWCGLSRRCGGVSPESITPDCQRELNFGHFPRWDLWEVSAYFHLPRFIKATEVWPCERLEICRPSLQFHGCHCLRPRVLPKKTHPLGRY